jgi:Large polyvalent protein associated domain 22/Acetyltransferase (GNAT) family
MPPFPDPDPQDGSRPASSVYAPAAGTPPAPAAPPTFTPPTTPVSAASVYAPDPTNDPLTRGVAQAPATSPDTAARILKLEQQTGLPHELIGRNLDTLETEVKRQGFDPVAFRQTSPLLAQWMLQHPLNIAVAQDDLGVLGTIEHTLRSTSDALWSIVGGGSARAAVTEASPPMQALEVGVHSARSALGGLYGGIEVGAWGTLRMIGDFLHLPGVVGFAQQAEKAAAAGEEQIAGPQTDVGPNMGAFYSGWQSVGSSLPIVGAELATGSAPLVLGLMAFQTGGKAYSQARDQGKNMLESLGFAVSQGAIESATEARPVFAMIEDLAHKSGLLTLLWHQALEEVPGELIATTLQNLNEWATLNPDTPFTDYLQALPRAWVDTVIATLTATISQTAAVHVLNRAVGGLIGQRFLEDLGEQAKASKLQQRSPEQFASYIAAATKDGHLETIYAPLDTWNAYWQSQNVDPATAAAQVTGSAEAYQAATDQGTNLLPINTALYAQHLATSDHNAFFSQEIRLDPDSNNARENKLIADQIKAMPLPALPEVSALQTALTEKLVAAGKPQADAEALASFAVVVTTLSDRLGLDLQAKQGYNIDVVRPDLATPPPAAPTTTPTAPGGTVSPDNLTEDLSPPATPEAVIATFLAHGPDGPLYNVPLEDGTPTTVSAEALTARGIAIPETPPAPAPGPHLNGDQIRKALLAEKLGLVDKPAPEAQTEAADGETPRPAPADAATRPGPDAGRVGSEQPAADASRVAEDPGHARRPELGRFPTPDPDEVFVRQDKAVTTARLTPAIHRELARIEGELDNGRPVKRTFTDVGDGPLTGNAGGGHYNLAEGAGGAPVWHDVLYYAPANKATSGPRKGKAAARAHGTYGDVLSAVATLRESQHVYTNLQEGVLRVAERRAAGDYTDLSPPGPDWALGVEAPAELTAALSEAIDAGLARDAAPTVDLLDDEGAIADADLNVDADTSFDVDEFFQSLFEDDPLFKDQLDQTRKSGTAVARWTPGRPGGPFAEGGFWTLPDGTTHYGTTPAAAQAALEKLGIDPQRPSEGAQPVLPGTENVRTQENATPTFEAPFSLTAETPAPGKKKGGQDTLFQGPRDEPQGFGVVSPHLRPEELAKLKRDHKARLVAIFKALPPDVDFEAAALGGKIKRGWYEQGADVLRAVFGEVDAPRFAVLLAATSPRVEVKDNLQNTAAIWANWIAAGRPTTKAAITAIIKQSVRRKPGKKYGVPLPSWVNNIHRALTADDPTQVVLSGPKVHSFYRNLIGQWHEVTNDAWMAAFAAVEQKIFGGSINKAGTDPGKTPGYLAMTAKIRRVAERLTRSTGQVWTPAEVQETVWSWAKTLSELADSEGETAEGILRTGKLTDRAILSTPDFKTLLTTHIDIRAILDAAGYGKQLLAFDADTDARRASGQDLGQPPGAGTEESGPGRGATIAELRAARRIDRAKRGDLKKFSQSAIPDEALTREAVTAWATDVQRRAGPDLTHFDVALTNQGDLTLGSLRVARTAQEQGVGTKALQELTRFADQHQVRVTLSPAGDRPRLTRFYQRFGFVENRGRRKDFTIRESMYREPSVTSPRTLDQPVEPKPTFYSRLERAIDFSPQARASGAQWKATITNAKTGINRDEFALTHVDDLEDARTYTKQEVRDYLHEHAVTIDEVDLSENDPDGDAIDEAAQVIYDKAIDEALASLEENDGGPDRTTGAIAFNEDEQKWEGHVGGDDLGEWFDTEEEAQAAVDRGVEAEQDAREERHGEWLRELAAEDVSWADAQQEAHDDWVREHGDEGVQYSEYQLPGKVELGSYHEVFLTTTSTLPAPVYNPNPKIELFVDETVNGRNYYGATIDGVVWAGHGHTGHRQFSFGGTYGATEEDRIARVRSDWLEQNRREGIRGWEDGHDQYSGIENPIVRLRFNTRTIDGVRTLFLEEVQPPSKEEQERMPALFTKNWRSMAMKWAIRYAADHGHEAIAWTPGQVQADRYSLERDVESIAWEPNLTDPQALFLGATVAVNVTLKQGGRVELMVDGVTKKIVAVQARAGLRQEVADQFADTLLAGTVGREIADKVFGEASGTLAGEGLKIGGTGLKRLYDVDFVNIVNGLPAVKAAGGRVATGALELPRPPRFDIRARGVLQLAHHGGFVLELERGQIDREHFYDTRAQAEAAVVAHNARLDDRTVPTMTVPLLSVPRALRDRVLEGQTLAQPGADEAGKRGSIRFGPNNQFLISLLERADPSTFLHEMGHFFLEVFGDAAELVAAIPVTARTPMQQRVADDYNTTLAWLGAKSRDDLSDPARPELHEQWARGFEAYLYEGKAPSLSLKQAFSRFRAWLLGTYQSLTQLRVTLTPEVRGVYDRLLASDRAIAEAEARRGQVAMFTTAKDAGMSDREFVDYQATVAEASRVARERLDRQALADVRQEQTAKWREAYDAVAQTVTTELHAQPVYQALAGIRDGTHPNGDPLIAGEETPPLKLSKDLIAARYGEARLKTLPRPYVYRVEGGIDPDVIAELYGFASGDALLTAIAQAPPLARAIDQETRRRLKAQRGDLLLDGTLGAVADEAVANEYREAVIRAEMRALGRLRKTVKPFVTAAREEGTAALKAAEKERAYERRWFEAETKLAVAIAAGRQQSEIDRLTSEVSRLRAVTRSGAALIRAGLPDMVTLRDAARERIAGTPIRQIVPGVFWSASRRAADQAIERAARQEFDGAITAKTQELVNLALYQEAERALEDVAARVKFAKTLTTAKVRARIGLAGASYLDQIDGILDRYSLAAASQKALDRRVGLREWIAGLEASGQEVELPDEVIDDAKRVHYKELTHETFVGVTDGLKQIAYLARLKNRLLKNADQRAFDGVRDDIVESIRTHNDERPKVLEFDRGAEKGRRIATFFAAHTKLAQIIQSLDGYVDGGPLWSAVMRPINAAGDAESMRRRAAGTAYAAILEAHFPGRAQGRLSEKIHIPAIDNSLSHEARLAVALNWGNDTSRDRIRTDPVRQWSEPQIQAILDTLDQNDWRFVQATWDHIDTYWPEIAAKQQRVTGLEPEKVEAAVVRTKFGDFKGGYYPLVADSRLHVRAIHHEEAATAKLATSAAYVKNTTQRGHTKARVAHAKYPVRLELGVVFQHLEQVLHDLTHHEMLIDVTRLLRDSQVSKAILDTHGDIVYRQIKEALNAITTGTPPQSSVDNAVNFFRTRTQIAAMGWNLWTAAQQPLGMFNGMERVGPVWVAKGMKRWLGDAATMQSTMTWITSVSPMMHERMGGGTMTQDLHDLRASFKLAGGWFDNLVRTVSRDTVTQQGITDGFLWHIGLMQRVADVPTWLGQYEKSMAAGEPEARAIAIADQAVLDSQGGGQIKDLSSVQRGGAFARLFMTFYSYGNTVYNATARAAGQTNFKSPTQVATFLGHLGLLYIMPSVLTVALSRAFGKSGDDDDKNNLSEYLLDVGQETLATALNTLVLVRELGALVQDGARGYEGPAGARAISLLFRTEQQIAQGELDEGLAKALNAAAGVVFRYPAGQVQRTIDGWVALRDHQTSNPMALLVGPNKKAAK